MEESLHSVSGEGESEMECSDNDSMDVFDYYNTADDTDIEHLEPTKSDPEYCKYECLTEEEVERLLNETVEILSDTLKIHRPTAKILLQSNGWSVDLIIGRYRLHATHLLIVCKVRPPPPPLNSGLPCYEGYKICPICLISQPSNLFFSLCCRHEFCKDCWNMHFEVQLGQEMSTKISCMGQYCQVIAPEDFVLKILIRPIMREKYQQYSYMDCVKMHPELKFCPGPNCRMVIRSAEPKAKRVQCSHCKTVFCFKCAMDYHAPTDCLTIKKWFTKCADDSETANYISAHTKDCPHCHCCIEKNGGCNHMQCSNCKYNFCWMCLGDWKNHGSEYYECSRYKENPNVAQESSHAQAREALKKYLHYYERWENHSKSLKLEVHTLETLRSRVNQKVMNGVGTWIDWQYMFSSATLLAKCRYTLQYTYPYAYFMENGSRKELFEYQQAQLEAEIENLSWKIERAESTDRGDLENQMDIAEKRRSILLQGFLDV